MVILMLISNQNPKDAQEQFMEPLSFLTLGQKLWLLTAHGA